MSGGPGCAERGDATTQKFSTIEFSDQECLPIFLFWTVVLAGENVNAKEPIEQNSGTNEIPNWTAKIGGLRMAVGLR